MKNLITCLVVCMLSGVVAAELYFSEDGNESGLYIIDTTDGAAENIGYTGVSSTTCGLAPSGDPSLLYGSKWSTLLHINSDGSGSVDVGGAGMEGTAYDSVTGTLYGAINSSFFTLDENTGEIVTLLTSPGADVEGMAFGRGGVFGIAGGSVNLFWYDPEADTWQTLGDTGVNWDACGLAYDPYEDVLFAKGDQDSFLYRIDPDSAATIVVGDTGIFNGGGLAFVAPEVYIGACCVGTSCSIGTDADCSAAGGTYLGDGSSCSGDPCGCLADTNGDGYVDVSDLLAVIDQWGLTNSPADVNSDGIVDLSDTLIVLSNWGPCSGGSNVWTVDDDGGADFDNIQDAVDVAADGDEIIVYPGTYTNTGDNVVDMMGKSVWLHSIDGPETTIIDGEDARRGIIYVNAKSASLGGFTIQNCYAPLIGWDDTLDLRLGGGLYIGDSSLVMTNCTIDSNDASGSIGWGGGVFSLNAINLVFTDCTFSNNFGDRDGGGVFHYFSIFELENCTFESNNASEGGGGLYVQGGSGTIVGCIISNNSALTGIVGSSGGGIHNLETVGGVITLTNTTVCDNTPDQIVGNWIDGGGNTVADSCSGDPTGACCVDTSCYVLTEVHCSSEGGTYLGDGSSCADNPCGDGTVDCACEAQYDVGDRVVSMVDNPDGQGKIWIGSKGTVVCGDADNKWALPILVEWDDIAGGHDGLGLCECGNTDPSPSSSRWWVECEWISLAGTVWTVDDSDGADFDNIQDAIDAASDGDEILVYPGTYTDTGEAVVDMMGKAVWLHSSDGPETTIIDGEDLRGVIICYSGETPESKIEGFTITK